MSLAASHTCRVQQAYVILLATAQCAGDCLRMLQMCELARPFSSGCMDLLALNSWEGMDEARFLSFLITQ